MGVCECTLNKICSNSLDCYEKIQNEPYAVMWFVGEGREVDVDTHIANFSILLVQFAVGVLDTSFTKHVYICCSRQLGVYVPSLLNNAKGEP